MKISLKLVAGLVSTITPIIIITVLAVNLGSRINDVDNRVVDVNSRVESAVSNMGSQVENIVSFLSTTTTSTTTTTTTTTTTLPPKPVDSRSELVRKVDEIYPGASTKYSKEIIEKAGKFACKRWNEAPITRINVMRDVMEYINIDDLGFAHAIAEGVVWTICWETRSFPNGPRDYR